MPATQTRRRSCRLELRVTPDERELTERAVAASETGLTDFVVTNVVDAARRVLAERDVSGTSHLSGHDGGVTATVSTLQRPVYGVVEAAGLLGLRPDRTRAWLDGYERNGVEYEPVVREKHTGDDIVTWGEFVELGYLREYRRSGIPLQRLRPVIDELRREFGTPYPLATARPFVVGKDLVLEIQERNDLPATIAIVVRSGQEIMLADGANRFFRKIEFDPRGTDAARMLPLGPVSPVAIDPRVRFGRPAVSGVATERLWELFDAGESVEEIATVYELSEADVRAAIAYEEQFRTLAA